MTAYVSWHMMIDAIAAGLESKIGSVRYSFKICAKNQIRAVSRFSTPFFRHVAAVTIQPYRAVYGVSTQVEVNFKNSRSKWAPPKLQNT